MLNEVGRERVRLRDVAKVSRRIVAPTALSVEVCDHYSLPAFDDGERPVRCPPASIKSAKQLLQGGETLISRLNPRVRRVWTPSVDEAVPALASTEFLAVIADETCVTPNFLHYAVLGPIFQEQLIRQVAGTSGSHQRVAPDEVLNAHIPLPSPRQQDLVAGILSALDAKRRANEHLQYTSQVLAQAVLHQSTIPQGSTRLGDVALLQKGLSYKGAHLAVQGMPMVNLANAATFGGFKRTGWKYYTGPYQPRHVAHGGDLLVANTDLTWKLEALGWPMLLPDDVPEALFSHHVTRIAFAPEWRQLRLPVWAHLFTTEARQRVEGMAHGTTVAALPKEALTDLEVPVLPADAPVLRQAEVLLQRAWAAERESEALVRLRDALLPGLMSGEIRVREAEERVGEVV